MLHFWALGVPKVTNFHKGAGPLATDESIFELNVSMRDARIVQKLHSTDELLEKVPGIILWEALGFADEAEELATCNKQSHT